MNSPSLSCSEVRMVDQLAMQEYAVPGVILMENAGRNATQILMDQGCKGPVLIACGKGNNGGDGFVIARHLDNLSIPVNVFLVASPEELKGDAKINYDIISKSGISIQQANTENGLSRFKTALEQSEWVVDALLGTGVSGKIRGIYKEIIQEINKVHCYILSVDIPSGLDGDSGEILGTAIKASCTVTFVTRKKGFDQPGSGEVTGRVFVADIGVPKIVLSRIITN